MWTKWQELPRISKRFSPLLFYPIACEQFSGAAFPSPQDYTLSPGPTPNPLSPVCCAQLFDCINYSGSPLPHLAPTHPFAPASPVFVNKQTAKSHKPALFMLSHFLLWTHATLYCFCYCSDQVHRLLLSIGFVPCSFCTKSLKDRLSTQLSSLPKQMHLVLWHRGSPYDSTFVSSMGSLS